VFDLDCDDEMRETIEKSARHLYGLVHARYIVTTRGLAKMVCDCSPLDLDAADVV
jgi:casein kinase II subunit beta